MGKLRIFLLGMGCFASFITLRKIEYYPFFYPQESLTRAWESVGNDIKTAIIREQVAAHGMEEARDIELEEPEDANA